MFGRNLILAGLVVYAVIAAGCLLLPAGERSQQAIGDQPAAGALAPLTGLPYRGCAMQLQRVDWVDKYETSIDEVAALGADTVSFVVDSRQENGLSTQIYVDMRKTLTVPQLTEVIEHAKSKGLRVVLMPIVLLDAPTGNEWRGTLKPNDWDAWFDSYRDMIEHYARVAEATHVNVLVVGSELVSSESHVDQWIRTIRAVRDIYHGQLTYSSNWDHYHSVMFWDQLDLIGMNSYWKLGKDHDVQIPEIVSRWNAIQSDLIPFCRTSKKPLILLEAGWCSLANAASAPWDYTQLSEPVDLDLQKRLYEGFFEAWYGNPTLGGFMIWDWPPTDGGPDDRGYTAKNKPAEDVLKAWLAKPRWKVN